MIRQSNYIPYCGIRGTDGSLVFSLERFGRIDLAQVRILPTSGVIATDLAPAYLKLTPLYPEGDAEKGKEFELGFEVENVGDRLARSSEVLLESNSDTLELGKPNPILLGDLRGSETGKFSVVGRRVGRYELKLAAGSRNTNSPSVEILAPINRPGQGSGLTWWPGAAIGAAVVVLGGLGVLVTRRRLRATASRRA